MNIHNNVLPVPEDEVEYEACYSKGDACSSQDGEDDSERKMYRHINLQGNTVVWNYTSWKGNKEE